MFTSDGYKTDDAVYFWNKKDGNRTVVYIPEHLSFLQYEMTNLILSEKNNSYNSGTSGLIL